MTHRNGDETDGFGVPRRGFLRLLGGAGAATAAGTAGCLNSETRIGYRDWVPGNFDPVVMYMNVDSMHEHGLLPDDEDDVEYGLTFDEVNEVIDLERATVLVLDDDASPEIDGEEEHEYGGFTVYDLGDDGYAATDGDSVVEARTWVYVELVIDAYNEELPRLHEEVPEFGAVTTVAGEGDLALVRPHETGEGGIEAGVANLAPETSDVTIAVTGEEEDDFTEIEDEIRTREHLTIDESRPDVVTEDETDVLVLEGTAETEDVPEAFGLVAEASSQRDADDVKRIDEGGESDRVQETDEEHGSDDGERHGDAQSDDE